MDELVAHYNKFNEEKRLTRRHGQVEYITTMKYIHQCLDSLCSQGVEQSDIRILDIGAGTGRYCVPLSEEGYQVSAVEYVKYNLGILKSKGSEVEAYQGDARKLKRFADDTFDLTLLFGPMYHLFTTEDKLQALMEAKRVTRPGGYVLVAYLMNEYGVLTYGFREQNALDCLNDGRLDENFHCHSEPKDLYDYLRLEDIDFLMRQAELKRIKIL
ncbi:MAG: methyltransferase domain-containing protein, partial [Lachnospiraceae bacterium]|nr:methyltransferase domain-containing protein [Lachnospiraceae bacterium]